MTAQQYKDNILGCYSSMLAVARRILGNEDEAQDAVQDVCRRLWEHCSETTVPANPGAFCAVSIRNHCLDVIRSRPLDAGDEPLASIAESKADDETDTEDTAGLLQKAIEQLERRSRLITMEPTRPQLWPNGCRATHLRGKRPPSYFTRTSPTPQHHSTNAISLKT